MTVGIYCYKDLQDNDSIVYIGKDSSIHLNKRHKDHIRPSNYDAQQINRVVQNNPDRYKYEILKSWESDDYHPQIDRVLEKLYVRRYNPKFNFTLGGDGIRGFKHSEETKQKIRESKLGHHHSEETKQKMSESRKGENHFAWKDYPRIKKNGHHKGKQQYAIKYNGKVIKQSIHLEKLQKELDLLINEVN